MMGYLPKQLVIAGFLPSRVQPKQQGYEVLAQTKPAL